MKTQSTGRFLLALAVTLLLAHSEARGAGTVDLVCNGAAQGPVVFTGLNALLACPAATIHGLDGRTGSAGGGADQTTAGHNFFSNGLSLNFDLSQVAQGSVNTFVIPVTSNPTWDLTITSVPTILAMTGAVQIPDPTGSLDFILTGQLGGFPPAALVGHEDHNNCAQCTLSGVSFRDQLPAPAAVETLTITTVGRVVFHTASPTFVGTVPEPSAWLLLGSGLVGLMLWRRRPFPLNS